MPREKGLKAYELAKAGIVSYDGVIHGLWSKPWLRENYEHLFHDQGFQVIAVGMVDGKHYLVGSISDIEAVAMHDQGLECVLSVREDVVESSFGPDKPQLHPVPALEMA